MPMKFVDICDYTHISCIKIEYIKEIINEINMKNKTIGWQVFETIGIGVINPMIYVYQTINENKNSNSINKDNIKELIKLCFSYTPHRKAVVLDIIERSFPQFIEQINLYKILL